MIDTVTTMFGERDKKLKINKSTAYSTFQSHSPSQYDSIAMCIRKLPAVICYQLYNFECCRVIWIIS